MFAIWLKLNFYGSLLRISFVIFPCFSRQRVGYNMVNDCFFDKSSSLKGLWTVWDKWGRKLVEVYYQVENLGGGVVPSREPLRLCHRHKWNGLEQGLVFQIDDDLVRPFFFGGGGLLLWWSVSSVRMKMWNVISTCKLLARKWQCGAFLNWLELSELPLLYTQLLDSSIIVFCG